MPDRFALECVPDRSRWADPRRGSVVVSRLRTRRRMMVDCGYGRPAAWWHGVAWTRDRTAGGDGGSSGDLSGSG